MVIVHISGGLGNQMFQYAMGRQLALLRHADLKLDLSEYRSGNDRRAAGLEAFTRKVGLHSLRISAAEASPAEKARLADPHTRGTVFSRFALRSIRRILPGFLFPASHLREKHYRFDAGVTNGGGDVYVDGFWQSYRYFQGISDIIREEFRPADAGIEDYARKYVEKLKEPGGSVVGLHVRRGDLAHAHEILKKTSIVHGSPVSTDYISAAMAHFDESARFLVFSDSAADIDWCRKNVRSDRLYFSENHTDLVDMNIMSRCDHNIIANSTFSWWAAWLNQTPGRRVIAPGIWHSPGAPSAIPLDDLIPADWEIVRHDSEPLRKPQVADQSLSEPVQFS